MQHLAVLRDLSGSSAAGSIELPKPKAAVTPADTSSGDSSTGDSSSGDSSTTSTDTSSSG
jgi:hypothetical protein